MQAYDTISQRAGTQALIPPNLLPSVGPQTPSPLSAPVTLKRNFPFENINVGREIRPKPSSIESVYGQASPIEQPPRKKRGRPTKAEAAARAEAQGGVGESSSATRPMSTGGLLPFPPAPAAEPGAVAETSPTEELRLIAPPVSRMPISSIITPTAPTTTSQSSSSSGKRRRGRSARSEPESFPMAGTLGTRPTALQQYESPYAGAGPDPSPAMTAVMRHRDEPRPTSPRQIETRTPATTYPPSTLMPEHTRST